MSDDKKELAGELMRQGISRRSFLKFCTSMASGCTNGGYPGQG